MSLRALRGQGATAAVIPEQVFVATAASEPDAGDDLHVLLEGFSTDQPVGPVRGWRLKGETPPVRGEKCLVLQVRGGDYWFVTWDANGW